MPHGVLTGNAMIADALRQMISYCKNSEEACQQHIAEYEYISARGLLHKLGFHPPQTDEIIEYIASEGFDYCLDPHVQSFSGVENKHFYPSADGCYWGADQLRSRLNCVKIPTTEG